MYNSFTELCNVQAPQATDLCDVAMLHEFSSTMNMKILFRLLTLLLLIHASTAFAQAPPQAFKYQSIVRNTAGNPLVNTSIQIRATVHESSATGVAEYQETHNAITNQFGLINLEIGTGTVVSGVFANIDWGAGTKWMQIEADFGTGYEPMGNSQLLSVPYALYAPNRTAGVTGTTSATGANGINGATGATSATGKGNTGTTGSTSATGINGITGATGATSATGKGNTGTTGSTSATGTEGITGATGSTSATGMGITGTTGSTSTTGEIGATGVTGSTSATGMGITGTTGSTSATGAEGITGATGSTSATGMGITGTTGSTSATGAEGVTGVTGSTSATGMGITGTTGSTSATGAEGITGATGSTSATGMGITGTTGSTSATGAEGITGVTGSTSATGAEGITGTTGSTSATGAIGITGTTGSTSTTGEIGATGVTGSTSATGAIGITGATGITSATGLQGITGATGNSINTYAEFYALMPTDNAATIAIGAPVLFPRDGPTDGVITRISAGTFQLTDVGTYQVFFQVSISEAAQLVLVLNGTELTRTVVGRATGTSQVVGMSFITTTTANSILAVHNPATNSTALTITPIAGGANAVSANLVIMRIK